MTAIGGSIQDVSLEGREFAVAADADSNRKLGGYENELQMNGNGTARLIKTAIGWKVDGLTLEIDDARGDDEFLNDLKDRSGYFAVSVTYASGETYQGQGQIMGEVQTSSQSQTASVSLSGPGKLTKQ